MPPLGIGREFDLIRRIEKRLGALAASIGDDAAALDLPRGEKLVASTDTALEDVHFRRSWLSMREIGYRAVTAALSDLAAMAATPKGVLIALELPASDRKNLDALTDGIADAVRAARTVVLGGNLSRGDALGITPTVLGSVFQPLSRVGARPGDLIYVTGALGGPAAAVRALKARKKPARAVRQRFAHPSARVAEAKWLATRGVVAAIDISDGLTSDAGHLAAASGIGVAIESERVPVTEGATEKDALGGGEEYELLVAARAPLAEDEFRERFGLPLTFVGRATEGAGRVTVTKNGKRVATPKGHDHYFR